MTNDVTKELLMLYFSKDCTPDEEYKVEKWMTANCNDTGLTEQWFLEMNNGDAPLFLKLLKARQEIWQKISLDLNQSL